MSSQFQIRNDALVIYYEQEGGFPLIEQGQYLGNSLSHRELIEILRQIKSKYGHPKCLSGLFTLFITLVCTASILLIVNASRENNQMRIYLGIGCVIGIPCLLFMILGYIVGQKGPFTNRLSTCIENLNQKYNSRRLEFSYVYHSIEHFYIKITADIYRNQNSQEQDNQNYLPPNATTALISSQQDYQQNLPKIAMSEPAEFNQQNYQQPPPPPLYAPQAESNQQNSSTNHNTPDHQIQFVKQ